ncbi:hypothetical protein M407DRAFT_26794 [Tulasnella calospora MUT 4182]|uniref:WW domain-containing protein n=1 Tax=Tulasnella calospora MUT 4182 TaxID=1051891 RepID=A0A0C3QDL1_9AGAM|nr:hypothetical protein M407DRAFT_26794 [Tulasnella calospora MUT 4182]
MALVLCPLLPEDLQELRPEHHQATAAANDQQPLDPWVKITHPDGDIYFYDPQNRVFTWTDPRDPDNAATLENATQQLRQQLTPAHFPNDAISVIGFTNEMRQGSIVGYYLVHNGLKVIGWIEPSPQALGLPAGFDENRFQSWLLPQYWTHIHFYPSGLAVDDSAEEGLIGRLIAGLLPFNHGMTPFSPEECRNYLSLVELNRNTQLDERRMTDIGRLLALICESPRFDYVRF